MVPPAGLPVEQPDLAEVISRSKSQLVFVANTVRPGHRQDAGANDEERLQDIAGLHHCFSRRVGSQLELARDCCALVSPSNW